MQQVAETEEVAETPVVAREPDGKLDCTLGLTNDPYLGECGRYLDKNADGVCGHSQ